MTLYSENLINKRERDQAISALDDIEKFLYKEMTNANNVLEEQNCLKWIARQVRSIRFDYHVEKAGVV